MKCKSIPLSNLNFPKDYSLKETGCTQSLVKCFHECPRKFLLKVNRWRKKGGQENASIGNLIHCALSIDYKKSNAPLYTISSAMKKINRCHISESGKYDYVEDRKMDIYKVIASVLLMTYMDYYNDDFISGKFINTEKEFSFIYNGVLWRGKRDGEHIVKKTNDSYIREIKNRGRINEDNLLSGLQFDFQGNLYVLSKDNEIFQSNKIAKPVSGFLYDMIRTPGTKPHKGESLPEFAIRLEKEIIKKPEYYFYRFEVPLTLQDKRDFKLELGILSDELTRYTLTSNPVNYRKSFSCIDGAFLCEYLEACTSGNLNNFVQSERIFSELNCGY